MPLPLVPIIIISGSALFGLGKGIKAVKDNSDAKDYNRWANDTVSDAKNTLEASRKDANTALEALGRKKLSVLDKSLSRFITSFEKLKNVKLEDSAGMAELKNFFLDKQSTAEASKLKNAVILRTNDDIILVVCEEYQKAAEFLKEIGAQPVVVKYDQ